MTHTENYNLNIVEGSDKVNLLTQMNPNTTAIDAQMKDNADHGIQDATELFTSTVHAITRQNTDAPIFRFTAVSNYTAGETFTVDGVQVTALLTSGEALTTGSFIIGSEVICALRDTLLTVFVNAGTAAVAKNAEKLGGELPEYYGTAEDVADAVESAGTALETATAASTAVGNLSSLTTSSKTSAVSAINEVNENLANKMAFPNYANVSTIFSGDVTSTTEYTTTCDCIVYICYISDRGGIGALDVTINGFLVGRAARYDAVSNIYVVCKKGTTIKMEATSATYITKRSCIIPLE